jgi:hypothetical protein
VSFNLWTLMGKRARIQGIGSRPPDRAALERLISLAVAEVASLIHQNTVEKLALTSFINQVSAQSGKKIDAAFAALLIGWTQGILIGL